MGVNSNRPICPPRGAHSKGWLYLAVVIDLFETFFKTLESELVWRTVFYSRSEAEQAIARYIDAFYNHLRRHSALDFISPAQYERLAAN